MSDSDKDSTIISMLAISKKADVPPEVFINIPTGAWKRLLEGDFMSMDFDGPNGPFRVTLLGASTMREASKALDQIKADGGIFGAVTH